MKEVQNKKQIASKWLALADEDLRVATLALDNGIYLQSSFHCQQAMEKSLKGLIILLKEEEPPYTHDLVRLYQVLLSSKYYDQKLGIKFAGVNPFYIQSRYPSYKTNLSLNLTKQKVIDYLMLAKEVYQWLEVEVKS